MKLQAKFYNGNTFTSTITGIETGKENDKEFIKIYTPDKILELNDCQTTFKNLIIKTTNHTFKFNMDCEIIQGPDLNCKTFALKEMNFKMLSDTLTTIYWEMED